MSYKIVGMMHVVRGREAFPLPRVDRKRKILRKRSQLLSGRVEPRSIGPPLAPNQGSLSRRQIALHFSLPLSLSLSLGIGTIMSGKMFTCLCLLLLLTERMEATPLVYPHSDTTGSAGKM